MIFAVDLFCGLGGLTHGLARSGVRVVAGYDLDPKCRYPYERNNAARFHERDIASLLGSDLIRHWDDPRHVSLLAGCAPCQPYSTYSRKVVKRSGGKPDGRWDLVADFGRLVLETRPALVTMENVPQLRDHPILDRFLATLEGYHLWCKVVECSDYGVPQTRKRLVLLASRLGPISLLPPPPSRPDVSVRTAIDGLPPLAAGAMDPSDRLHFASKLSRLNLARIRASRPGGSWRDWDESLVADCHRRKSGSTFPSVYGRMTWDDPSPTITTQCFGFGNGRFGHPEQDRAITLREAALLQTFPEEYEFLEPGEPVLFAPMGRLIGNAVPVRLGEVIGRTFLRHVKDYAGGVSTRARHRPRRPAS